MGAKKKEVPAKRQTSIDPSHYTPHRITLQKRATEIPHILTAKIAEELRPFLPIIQKESNYWDLLYSTEQHGISLATMYQRGATSSNPCILVIRDNHEKVFGAYLSEPCHHHKGYYGNGTCFLWKQYTNGHLGVYLSTGLNEHYILSEHGASLAFGGGENGFALWVDEQLLKGYSSTSTTYNNQPLTDKKDFEIVGLELWEIVS
ncbi:oxidation resistance protein 1 [Boothiomyces sp. JEL0866]|nr:oxidation resistance protein 1 [Boothiomyces sp. JEL0866]